MNKSIAIAIASLKAKNARYEAVEAEIEAAELVGDEEEAERLEAESDKAYEEAWQELDVTARIIANESEGRISLKVARRLLAEDLDAVATVCGIVC